jgi:predicted  nucleic acid-binding Zn-ribbon protein
MLNELENLSVNIGRLIDVNRREHETGAALCAELTQLRAQCAAMNTELEQVRSERDALQAERDTLADRIADAQVRLNAILEKLPHSKSGAKADNQFDLLEDGPTGPDEPAAGHSTAWGENA